MATDLAVLATRSEAPGQAATSVHVIDLGAAHAEHEQDHVQLRHRDGRVGAGLDGRLHREVPAGDGGISYGQAVVAAARIRKER